MVVEANVELNECLLFSPIKVGLRSYANMSMIRANTEIGRYCSIGRRCTIAAAMHDVNRMTTHPVSFDPRLNIVSENASLLVPRGVKIGHDVWIGDNVVIMDGVNIGTGAVIGAGAVVTKDVPHFAIVGGVPAKTIRARFSKEIIDRILAIEWWSYGDDILRGLDLRDIETALMKMDERARSLNKLIPHHAQH